MMPDIPAPPGMSPEEMEGNLAYAVIVAKAAVRLASIAHVAVFSHADAKEMLLAASSDIPEELEPFRLALCGHISLMRLGGA